MYYNKSLIFKNAWILKKKHDYSFSKSLKIAWKHEKTKIKNVKFNEIIKKLSSNINYYSFYISSKSSIQKDEAKQRIMIKIFNSLDKFNEKKSSLKTFFNEVLKNFSFDLLRKEYSKKPETCIDKVNIGSKSNEYSRFELAERLRPYQERFDNASRKILNSLLKGDKQKDIAFDLGISHSNVSNIIRRKIRPELVKEFY